MLLGTQLPEWKQIIGRNKKNRKRGFYNVEDGFFLSESCMSINLIINAYKKVKGKNKVYIWLPDFFCNQTVYSFKEDWMIIVYYPIDKCLDPNWHVIREQSKEQQLDIFIFTHYFGKYHSSICNAKEICKMCEAILIEDCAHILYATGKIGKSGDFVIYSPHKQIPVCDGAVLQCNKKDSNIDIYNEVSKLYQGLKRKKNDTSWYIKKGIQKILPVHRALTYYSGVHIGDNIKDFHAPKKISPSAYNVLCAYTYEQLKKIAYIRRDNLETINFIMKRLFPDIMPLMDSTSDVPYMAVYSLENYLDKKSVTDELLKKDFTVLYWPDIPYNLKKTEEHLNAFILSENVITLPIHQGITPQQLIKKFCEKREERKKYDITIDIATITKERWDSLFSQYKITNIPQEWIYGETKSKTEGWKIIRGIIVKDGRDIGSIQILEKKIAGLTVAVRVNRGPLLAERYNNFQMHLLVMRQVQKMYRDCTPILWAPYLKMCPDNLKAMSDYGWRCRNYFGFSSSIVDLSLSEDKLYKNLKSNWRKNLNKAKKCVSIRFNDYNAQVVIRLYDQFLKKKNIPGIPQHILTYLFNLDRVPLEVLTAHNEKGEMIAYKVLYLHGNTATSFIAWNTDEGLEKNARTLLIYESMIWLKKNGFDYFDLGGVDDISTEAVAKYKRGMGGTDYRLIGEFIKY